MEFRQHFVRPVAVFCIISCTEKPVKPRLSFSLVFVCCVEPSVNAAFLSREMRKAKKGGGPQKSAVDEEEEAVSWLSKSRLREAEQQQSPAVQDSPTPTGQDAETSQAVQDSPVASGQGAEAGVSSLVVLK